VLVINNKQQVRVHQQPSHGRRANR